MRQCCRERMGSGTTTLFCLSLPIVRLCSLALSCFSTRVSVFTVMGESRHMSELIGRRLSSLITFASEAPQWQCRSTRERIRAALLTCLLPPESFALSFSGSHSTSAPLSCMRSFRLPSVMRCGTTLLRTLTSRVVWASTGMPSFATSLLLASSFWSCSACALAAATEAAIAGWLKFSVVKPSDFATTAISRAGAGLGLSLLPSLELALRFFPMATH
mmetsp:Transcript_1816/g.5170  ORF Transcript_1816/g.5170 Transcript_1816/m.5170 type:complete len:217 (-) Transcript_1816:17-667(-)